MTEKEPHDTSSADDAQSKVQPDGREDNRLEQESLEQEGLEQEQPADEYAVNETPGAEQPDSGSEQLPDDEQIQADKQVEAADKKPGRGLLWLVLLLALGGLAGSGYLYYQLIYLNPLAEIEQNIQGTSTARSQDIANVNERIAQQATTLNEQLVAAREAQTAELAETKAGVMASLQQSLLAAPPSQREWKLAEAEYLLRIGNHRVLMEQDTEGALMLFLAVDQILAELDDFALHQVRAILADEIIALRQVPRTDLQGIYLRLEAIKSSIDRIAYKTPEYIVTEVAADAEETVWSRLVKESKKFFEFRPLGSDETIKPLLAPAQEQYLELNLRLALEQAQLAALKRQQAVFVHALQNVRDWLAQYSQDPQTVLGGEIEELLRLELERPLPDISGSLTELHKVRQGGE